MIDNEEFDLSEFCQVTREMIRPHLYGAIKELRSTTKDLQDLRIDLDHSSRARTKTLLEAKQELAKQTRQAEIKFNEQKELVSLLAQGYFRWDPNNHRLVNADPWDDTMGPYRQARFAELNKTKHKSIHEQIEHSLLRLRYEEDYP